MTDVAHLYPPTPAAVPPDLTKPTGSYRFRVVIVLLCLVVFVGVYLGLTVGSAYTCYACFSALGDDGPKKYYTERQLVFDRAQQKHVYRDVQTRPMGRDDKPVFWLILGGIGSACLFLFLVKGLFKRSQRDPGPRVEVTEKDQPALFAFIRQLCKDTGAPFPHRVFVTPDVNAALFFQESLPNLLFPSRKNLILGLGLVNRLNLTEFKAVLAHEFGHFSQNSMKLGATSTANRVIADVVYAATVRRPARRRSAGPTSASRSSRGASTRSWTMRKTLDLHVPLHQLRARVAVAADGVQRGPRGRERDRQRRARLRAGPTRLRLRLARAGVDRPDRRRRPRPLHARHVLPPDEGRGVPQGPPQRPGPRRGAAAARRPHADRAGVQARGHQRAQDVGHAPRQPRPRGEREVAVLPRAGGRPLGVGVVQRPRRGSRGDHAQGVRDRPEGEGAGLEDPEAIQAFIDAEHAETTYNPRYHGLYENRYVKPGDLAELCVRAAREEFDDRERLAAAHVRLWDDEVKDRMAVHKTRHEEVNKLGRLAHGAVELTGKDFEHRGRRFTHRDAARLLKEVEKELDKDYEWMHAVDRDVFRVHFAMAWQLGETDATELEGWYRFHIAMQDLHSLLAAHMRHAQTTLAGLGNRRQVSQEEFQGALGALRGAHDTLRAQLNGAYKPLLPPLKNMKAGEPLGPFLLAEPLIQNLHGGETSLDGRWITPFFAQMGEVIDKSARILFKSLGGLLSLQERIAERWAAPPAPAPATTDEPPAGDPPTAPPDQPPDQPPAPTPE